MLILLLVILAVGALVPTIIHFANRLARAKSSAKLRRENMARIKSDLDELSHAFDNGIVNEKEFEKKSDLLIDKLSDLIHHSGNK